LKFSEIFIQQRDLVAHKGASMQKVQVTKELVSVQGFRGNVTSIPTVRGKLVQTRKVVDDLLTPQLDLILVDPRQRIDELLSKQTVKPMMVPTAIALVCFMGGWPATQLGPFASTLLTKAYEELAAANRLDGNFQESELEALFSGAIQTVYADVMGAFRKRLSVTDRVYMEIVGANDPQNLVHGNLLSGLDAKRQLLDDPLVTHFAPFTAPRKSPPSDKPSASRPERRPQQRDVYIRMKGAELRLAPDFTPTTYALIARKTGVLDPDVPAKDLDLNALAKEVFDKRCGEGIGGPCPLPKSIEIVIRVLRVSGMTTAHAWQLSGPAIAYVFDKMIGREGVRKS
jgi:hypothetical protein